MPDYKQTLDYLFTRLPMFSRIGAVAYKANLSNTIGLCHELGNPQNKFKSIHVAGTNGKGSTSHMLAAVFQTAGYKTGLYTSPHLKDFRERIKINGEMVSEAFVMSFTEQIKELIEEIEPSFFEITVAMAFSWFETNNVDIAIIETGLGGRLDSTNIITPELSIITNIGFDHMNLLGNTLEAIAAEKAGIIKKNIPVVIGESSSEIKSVFEKKADFQASPIYFSNDRYLITNYQAKDGLLSVRLKDNTNGENREYYLDLPGIYQIKNLKAVLCSLDIIKNSWKIKEENITNALCQVKKLTGLHGRWEVIQTQPYTVLDVAHNEDGIKQVLKHIGTINHNKLHIVIGMVKDKAIENVLALLPKNANYYFASASIPRALPAEELKQKAENDFSLTGNSYENVTTALQQAINCSQNNDVILVCGSVFLIGEVNTGLILWN